MFRDNTPRLGAAIAYYTIFSLGPLLVIVVAVAGLIFGQDVVRGELTGELTRLLGPAGGTAVEAMLADASRPRDGILASLLGIGLLFIGVFAVTSELKDALNIVLEVPSQPDYSSGVRTRLSVVGGRRVGARFLVDRVRCRDRSGFRGR